MGKAEKTKDDVERSVADVTAKVSKLESELQTVEQQANEAQGEFNLRY